nr:hypothetical protein Iba_chr05dCG2340 [Ipomoea batatas]
MMSVPREVIGVKNQKIHQEVRRRVKRQAKSCKTAVLLAGVDSLSLVLENPGSSAVQIAQNSNRDFPGEVVVGRKFPKVYGMEPEILLESRNKMSELERGAEL